MTLVATVQAELKSEMSGMISNQTTISDAHKSTAPTIPRLLYRGSLSLPDSNLLLDGLTFSIQLPSDDPQASRTLLETPLPLDLESMRGRPSLSLVGVVKLSELHCDFEEGASLYVHHTSRLSVRLTWYRHIHPRCILTKQFFVHNLCAESITSPQGRTELAIRVRLGEADATGPSPSDIVVYGRPHPSSSIMQLHVARIATAPASAGPPKPITTKPKPPRPDDPIPRKPPAGYAGIARIGLGMKRTASTASVGLPKEKEEKKMVEKEATRKKARKEEEARKFDEGVFKVPPVPPAKGKQETVTAPLDVFDALPDDNGKLV